MKAMNFQDHIPSNPIENFEIPYVLILDLISMQEATENCCYPELIGEPLRLELKLTFPLEHFTELFVVVERMSLVAVDEFGVVGENIEKEPRCLPEANQLYPFTQVSVLAFNPIEFCSNSSH